MWPSVAVSDFPLGATYWGVTLWIWVVLLQQEGARAELSCGICPSVSKLSLLWTNSSYCVHCLCWNPAALETFERPCPSLLAQKDRPCHCCSFSPDHYWVCAETLSDITQPEQTTSFIEKSQPSPAISVISFCGVRECRSGSSVLSRFHSLVSWGRGCQRDRYSSFPAGGSRFQFVLAKVEPDPWGISPVREQRHKICEVAPTVDRFIWVIERGDVSET